MAYYFVTSDILFLQQALAREESEHKGHSWDTKTKKWYFETTKKRFPIRVKHIVQYRAPGCVIISVSVNGFSSMQWIIHPLLTPPSLQQRDASRMLVFCGEEPDVFLFIYTFLSYWLFAVSSFLKRMCWRIYNFLQKCYSLSSTWCQGSFFVGHEE